MTLTTEQLSEIAARRAESTPTLRSTVPALEELLFSAIPLLDHGFLRVIDYMGWRDRAGGAGFVWPRHPQNQ